jgi:hypothetical protein
MKASQARLTWLSIKPLSPLASIATLTPKPMASTAASLSPPVATVATTATTTSAVMAAPMSAPTSSEPPILASMPKVEVRASGSFSLAAAGHIVGQAGSDAAPAASAGTKLASSCAA